MILVFGAFLLGDNRVIKLFGFGLAIAVLLDALIVRALLVPALMHLLGRANWVLPAALDRVIPRLNVEGHGAPAATSLERLGQPPSMSGQRQS
jgi:RND superfamily putative drug exporter